MPARSSVRVLVVFVTCPSAAVARRLARYLVRRRLAACVNVVPGLTSYFHWAGKLERARETLLILKTTAGTFAPLRRALLTLHPYDSPEIIALPVVAGHAAYLRWVRTSVKSRGDRQ